MSDVPAAIANFGGNVCFQPKRHYSPRNEAEVLEILDRHAEGKIRVMGTRHSWSEATVTEDVLIDLCHFQQVMTEVSAEGDIWATIGGGCPIHRALDELARQANATLPTLGLITEQTIAGAISTATHGSGRSSMSHHIAEIRAAAYDPETGKARIFVYNDGAELRAARCALGCMGIILSVRLRCLPQYAIEESVCRCATLDEALAGESEHPLQQFYLIPHSWAYYVQRRKPLPVVSRSPDRDTGVAGSGDPATTHQIRRSWRASIYRVYWYLMVDVSLHVLIKLFAAWLGSRRLVHLLYRWVLPMLLWKPRRLVDRSDRILVMEHELFCHLEIEIFVPASQVRQAADFVKQVMIVFDGGTDIDAHWSASLEKIGLIERLTALRGTFTFHYPITFRRVLPDDTLISMTADAAEPFYAISLITYVMPRDKFLDLARFLAESMVAIFGARLHWGKYFPLNHPDIAASYPHLPEFRELCRRVDPLGVFRNAFTDRVLGLAPILPSPLGGRGVGGEGGSP